MKKCSDCEAGDGPKLLDKNGVLSSLSGELGTWCHAYDIYWWPCENPPNKAMIIFEDWSEERQEMAWYFSFCDRIHGPFDTKTEAEHALDALMSDFYQDDSEPAA